MTGVLHGNFGMSYQYNSTTVASLIGHRVGPSILISFQALVLGVVVGILLGCVGALKKGTWADATSSTLAVIGISFPQLYSGNLTSVLSWF